MISAIFIALILPLLLWLHLLLLIIVVVVSHKARLNMLLLCRSLLVVNLPMLLTTTTSLFLWHILLVLLLLIHATFSHEIYILMVVALRCCGLLLLPEWRIGVLVLCDDTMALATTSLEVISVLIIASGSITAPRDSLALGLGPSRSFLLSHSFFLCFFLV